MTNLSAKIVVDECSFAAEIGQDIRNLEKFIELVEFSGKLKNTYICANAEFLYQRYNGKSAHDYLYDQAHFSNDEIRSKIMIWGQTEQRIIKHFKPEEYLTAKLLEAEDENNTIGFMLFGSSNPSCGVITFLDYSTSALWQEFQLKKIDSEDSAIDFHYNIISKGIVTKSEFEFWYEILYPKLYFNSDAAQISIDNIRLPLNELLPELLNALHYLNNFGQDDFRLGAKMFKAKAGSNGVDLSEDSSKTNNNAEAKKKRDIVIAGIKVPCEWHFKIRQYGKNAGRVHFHEGTNLDEKILKITNKRLIIGIFNNHLKT